MSVPDTPKLRRDDLPHGANGVAAATASVQDVTAMAVEVQRTPAIGAPTITAHSRLLTEERDHPRRHGAVAFRRRTNSMNTEVLVKPDTLIPDLSGRVSPITFAATGEIKIAGRHYVNVARRTIR